MGYVGTILPIRHTWWNTHLPPSDWNCKCWVKQTDKEPTDVPNEELTPPVFANNPGETAEFVNIKEHPYVKGVCPYFNSCRSNGKKELANKPKHPACAMCILAKEYHKKLRREERKKQEKAVKEWFNNKLKTEKYLTIKGEQFKYDVKIDRTAVRELLGHIASPEHKVIVKDMETVLQKAIYQKGNDQDLDLSKPNKNLAKKRNRGVVYYRYYTSDWKNFIVKIAMEVNNKKIEQPYTFTLIEKKKR